MDDKKNQQADSLNTQEECICTGFRKLSRIITQMYDKKMPSIPVGKGQVDKKMRITQFAVLKAISDRSWVKDKYRNPISKIAKERLKRSEEEQCVVQIDLAKHLSLDTATLSRNIKIMCENNWIEPTPIEKKNVKPGDISGTRERYIRLTENGEKVYNEACKQWEEAQKELLEKLQLHKMNYKKIFGFIDDFENALFKINTNKTCKRKARKANKSQDN